MPPPHVFPKTILRKIVEDKYFGTMTSGLSKMELDQISLVIDGYPPDAFVAIVDGISRAPTESGKYFIAEEDMSKTLSCLFDSKFYDWYNKDDSQARKQMFG